MNISVAANSTRFMQLQPAAYLLTVFLLRERSDGIFNGNEMNVIKICLTRLIKRIHNGELLMTNIYYTGSGNILPFYLSHIFYNFRCTVILMLFSVRFMKHIFPPTDRTMNTESISKREARDLWFFSGETLIIML